MPAHPSPLAAPPQWLLCHLCKRTSPDKQPSFQPTEPAALADRCRSSCGDGDRSSAGGRSQPAAQLLPSDHASSWPRHIWPCLTASCSRNPSQLLDCMICSDRNAAAPPDVGAAGRPFALMSLFAASFAPTSNLHAMKSSVALLVLALGERVVLSALSRRYTAGAALPWLPSDVHRAVWRAARLGAACPCRGRGALHGP